jgi:hypothetical protein
MLAPLAAAALVAALCGCGGDSDDGAQDGDATSSGATSTSESNAPTGPGEESDSPTGEPTESATSGIPTDGPDPSDSTPARAKKAQIPASAMPGLNDQWFWKKQSAGPGPGTDVPSVCQKASLTSIGAVTEYRTNYASPLDRDAYAVQMTGVFPDEQTVATTEEVLQAWHGQCKTHASKDLGLQRVKVGELATVPTEAGEGHQWLTIYGPAPGGSADEGWFEAFGYVADGDTLTVLVIANVGQDYNYEAGQQPMDLAVQEAARRLIASRG